MKKLLVFPVLLLLLIPAFAQEEKEPGWKFSGEVEVFSDLLYYTHASGKSDNGTDTTEYGKSIDGSINMMNSSNGAGTQLGFDTTLAIEGYDEGDNWMYDVLFQMKMGTNFERAGAFFGYGMTESSDGGITGNGLTILDLFGFAAEEWHVLGRAGILEGYIGNDGYVGAVDTYGNFTDWSNFYFEDFYVNKMGDHLITNSMIYNDNTSAFALGLNLSEAFRIALGTSFNTESVFDKGLASAGQINMGVMASIKDIGDFLTLDLFYAITGKDTDTNVRGGAAYDNLFGIYAGLGLGDTFGLSLGYSGYGVVNETQQGTDKSKTFNNVNPLWSSIHIHLNFTGVDKLNLTFNNNISFAGTKGKEIKADEDVIYDLQGSQNGNDKYSDSWFGWDAGLAAHFALSEELTLSLQLINQLGVFTATTDDKSSVSTGDIFFIGLNAEYTAGAVTFGTGLNFTATGTTSESPAGDKTATSSATVGQFGIPLYFKVAF